MAINNTNNYLISVITPCYQIDMDLFVTCYESLKKQTIGFDKIEWVVVSHNSGDEQIEKIKNIVAGEDNVKVYKFDNDKHTPSGPRNYGIARARGKYIGFLDSDDTYYPDVLKQCYMALEEERAQVASFRMDTDSDSDANLVVKQFCLLDQTRDRIVLKKGQYDQTKVINGPGLMITTKIYSRSFINSINLRFDEDVSFAEDVLFNIHVFAHMKKIIILPQLIGYRYFLNGGSLVQALNKKEEDIWMVAVGARNICDAGLSYGLYANRIMCSVLGYLSLVMIISSDVSLEFREKVADLLGDYIQFLEPIEPSKLEDPKSVKMMDVLPKMVITKPKAMDRLYKLVNKLGIDIEGKVKFKIQGGVKCKKTR